jgi:hypothetical protein
MFHVLDPAESRQKIRPEIRFRSSEGKVTDHVKAEAASITLGRIESERCSVSTSSRRITRWCHLADNAGYPLEWGTIWCLIFVTTADIYSKRLCPRLLGLLRLIVVLHVDLGLGELSRRDLSPKENIDLSVRTSSKFWQGEECSDEADDGSTSPDKSALSGQIPTGRIEHLRSDCGEGISEINGCIIMDDTCR